MDVRCPLCGEKIAEYKGEIGHRVPIQSQYYVRVDGSSPEHGSSTLHGCPHCAALVNELEATMNAILAELGSKRPETEVYLEGKSSHE